MVQWCLVVTTPLEIILLALVWEGSKGNQKTGPLRVLPTRFVLPTDHVSMVSITGCYKTGRIFLGGQDGNLYEMVYGGPDDGYNQGGNENGVRSNGTAKRLYSLVTSGSTTGPNAGYECYKINHTGSMWSSFMPSLRNSSTDKKKAIISVDVDQERNTLFTLSYSGEIRVYDLTVGIRHVGSVNAITVCRNYVTSVKQGRM